MWAKPEQTASSLLLAKTGMSRLSGGLLDEYTRPRKKPAAHAPVAEKKAEAAARRHEEQLATKREQMQAGRAEKAARFERDKKLQAQVRCPSAR